MGQLLALCEHHAEGTLKRVVFPQSCGFPILGVFYSTTKSCQYSIIQVTGAGGVSRSGRLERRSKLSSSVPLCVSANLKAVASSIWSSSYAFVRDSNQWYVQFGAIPPNSATSRASRRATLSLSRGCKLWLGEAEAVHVCTNARMNGDPKHS